MTTSRRYAIEAGALILALAVAFGAGRYSRPTKVVTKVEMRTEVQYRDRVQVQTVHDVAIQHDTQAQTRTVTVTRWAKAPDGTPVVTQETHQEQQQATQASKAAETRTDAQRTTEAHQATQETRTVTVTAERPQWSVSALAGVQFGGLRLIPGLPAPLVAGVAIDRRIIGPVSAGVWGTSGGAAGVLVRFEF